jgi:hypothetical protein
LPQKKIPASKGGSKMQEDKQTYYEKTDAKIRRVSIASKPDLGSGRSGLLNGNNRKGV